VGDAGRGAAEFDRHRAVRGQVLAPIDGGHPGIELIGVRCRKRRERHQNTRSGARPEASPIGGLERAFELDAELELARPRSAARTKLRGGEIGNAGRTGSEEEHSLWVCARVNVWTSEAAILTPTRPHLYTSPRFAPAPSARRSIERHDRTIQIRPAIPKHAPRLSVLANAIEIEAGGDDGFARAIRLFDNRAGVIGDERRAVISEVGRASCRERG